MKQANDGIARHHAEAIAQGLEWDAYARILDMTARALYSGDAYLGNTVDRCVTCNRYSYRATVDQQEGLCLECYRRKIREEKG